MTNFRILDWRPLAKNTPRGFAKVELPSGMPIADGTVLAGNVPIIEFSGKEIRNRVSDSMIEALRQAHPEALNGAA